MVEEELTRTTKKKNTGLTVELLIFVTLLAPPIVDFSDTLFSCLIYHAFYYKLSSK